jgi:protein-S-isoprenylcysteine O-methyltransferase Ste14
MQGEITELQVHFWMVLVMIALAVQAFVLLLLVNAPYGRFTRTGWGPTISTRRAWIIFESPAVVVFAAIYFAGDNALETVPLIFFSIWQFHYIVRALIFPFRLRETGKRIPAIIVAIAIIFNLLNAYINARWISHLGNYPLTWIASTPFLAGVMLFFVGWFINQHADLTLHRLRNPGETHYSIPRGGLYKQVSCPNYLGEIIEWTGWAIMTWSLAGLAFAILTIANLVPRAVATHRWYRNQFPDYPKSRRAVIPYLL